MAITPVFILLVGSLLMSEGATGDSPTCQPSNNDISYGNDGKNTCPGGDFCPGDVVYDDNFSDPGTDVNTLPPNFKQVDGKRSDQNLNQQSAKIPLPDNLIHLFTLWKLHSRIPGAMKTLERLSSRPNIDMDNKNKKRYQAMVLLPNRF